MSVQVNTYVLQGVIFPYDLLKDRDDDLVPYIDSAFDGIHHHKGLCVLIDGMDGKYVAVGRVLHKTNNHGSFGEPITIKPLDEHSEDMLRVLIKNIVDTKFDIGLHIISHYR